MAFEATTPFALECLSDNVKSAQSLQILGQSQSPELRAQELLGLAKSWNITMTDKEAHEVVAEYDRVLRAQPSARRTLGSSLNGLSAASAASAVSAVS